MLILASGSVWRRRLLKKHGYAFKVMVSDFDEIKAAKNPALIPLYNAYGKAETVREELLNRKNAKQNAHKNTYIIGVDTIGVLGKSILLKPKDRADAKRMLKKLSGTEHAVVTGLVVLNVKTGVGLSAVVRTGVTFKKVGNEELEKYLDSNQWVGKAGSYAIQGRAKGFVEKIDGDRTNVVGLPIQELKILLKQLHVK